MKKTQSIKQGLLLLGSFAIAYNLCTLLHELSHGLAAILTDGSFSGIVINPFSWSYSYSYSTNHLLHISAGAVGAILLSGLIFLILYRWAKPWLLPLLLMGPIALIKNGVYYIVDIIMHSGGDACSLIDEGIPPAISIGVGTVFVIAGLILTALLIRKTGLLTFAFKERLVVLGLGILPNTLASLIWNCIYNRDEAMLWSVYTITTIILTLIFAAIPYRIWKADVYKTNLVSWKTVFVINCAYIGLLVFWFVGPFSVSSDRNPFNIEIERFSERPDSFPEVMTAPSYATDISYSCSSKSKRPYLFSYNFPESTLPEQIRNYISKLHNEHGYILLTHSIDDPNQAQNISWLEETDETCGNSFKTKHCKQLFLKVSSQPLWSFVAITYVWKKNKFQTAYVIEAISEYRDFGPLYNYATVYPKQFDPNDIEQLRKLSLAKKETLEDPNQATVESPNF